MISKTLPRNYNSALELFSSRTMFIFFGLVLTAKIAVALMIFITGNDFFGGGNDSRYYNAYAIGATDIRMHLWPVILRRLNDFGLYSREGVSTFLKFLGFLVLPLLVAKLSLVEKSPLRNRVFWYAAVAVSIYPTIFYYTTDIYRDVFMWTTFLIGVFIFKYAANNKELITRVVIFMAGMAMGYLLLKERGYLGGAYFCALLAGPFFSLRRFPFWLTLIVFVLLLTGMFAIGLLDPIVEYRDLFFEHFTGAGTNLGIRFDTLPQFVPSLLKSFIYQVFGLYFDGLVSLSVFLLESIPFLCALVYIVRNRAFSNKFVDYLFIFFITYSAIWLIGNDNLGTAVRLRVLNYLVTYVAMFVIYQNKKLILNASCDANHSAL